jgi:hypothetical protein
MKKFFYSFIIVALTITTFTSCTDEEVKPQTETGNGGGSPLKD